MRQALSFHHSAGLLTVLFMLLMTLPGGLRAQQILSVRTIDGMAPGRSAMPVSERVSVAGNFDFDGQGERVSVQLAWRRQGEDAWWVSKPSDPIAVAKAGQGWTLTDVPIGKAFDFRRQLEMMMIAMPAGKAFPEGITDFNAVILSALARSPRYRVYRGSRSRDVFMITPRVRIDQVDGEGVEPEAHLEVGLKPVLTGEVRRPSDGLLRLVVQPLSGDQLWVLPEDPLVRNGRWIAPVDLALADYAHLTEFLVFAVLSRGELPLDKAIDNQRWGELQAQEIMASSSKIRLTRIEAPLPKGEAALRILAVNDQPVRKGETLAVPSQSLIQGVILGRNLQSNEAIWVLGADPYAKEAWRVLGKAEVLNQGRHWNYAPGELGRPGSFLRIVAIIGPLQRNGLDAFLKQNSPAFSGMVNLQLSDQPPLEVRISRVDRVLIGPNSRGASISAPSISAIEGQVAGRPLQGNEKIWIMKLVGEKWRLIGQGAFRNRESWAMPPIALGEQGEEMTVMAVVSPDPVQTLSLNEQGAVLATSNRVKVQVR